MGMPYLPTGSSRVQLRSHGQVHPSFSTYYCWIVARPDRELFLVPRKGRPISQCQHCRTERKGRSAHVKCECGANPFPGERCFYKHKAGSEVSQSIAFTAAAVDGHPPYLQSMSPERTSLPNDCFTDKQHCCCPHGGKCICIGPKRERPGGNDTSLMKNSHTSGPCTQDEPRSATQESEAQGVVNLSDRSQLLQSVSSAHSQVHSPSILPRRTDAYYEQTTSPYPGDGSARVQDRCQAWPGSHQSVIPTINNHILDLSLLEQGYSHFLYDLNNSSLPLHDDMPSSANTFAGMLDPTYQGSGNSSVPTIPPTIAMSNFSATSLYPTAWSSIDSPTNQWSAIDWTGNEPSDWALPEVMSGAMTGSIEENDNPAIAEDTSWTNCANAHENTDTRLQIGFDAGALRDAESEYEWRMAVQPPQSDTIYFETTGDIGQFETF